MKVTDNITKYFLSKMSYKVSDNCVPRNKIWNFIDNILAFLYMLISIINAKMGTYHLYFNFTSLRQISIENIVNWDIETKATLLLMSINWIILFRLHIKIKVELIDTKTKAAENIYQNEDYKNIIVKALEFRLKILKYIYLIFAVISIFIIHYKNSVISSVISFAYIASALTFFNDVLINAINKYSATPIVNKLN